MLKLKTKDIPKLITATKVISYLQAYLVFQ